MEKEWGKEALSFTNLVCPHNSLVDGLEKQLAESEAKTSDLAAADERLRDLAERAAALMDEGRRQLRSSLMDISYLQRSVLNLQQHMRFRSEALRQQVH